MCTDSSRIISDNDLQMFIIMINKFIAIFSHFLLIFFLSMKVKEVVE